MPFRSAIFIFLLLSCLHVSAQDQPEFVSTTGHTMNIRRVAFSPDGKHIATLGNDRMLKIWDLSMKMEFLTITTPRSEIKAIGYSPDGSRLAAYSLSEQLYVWDTKTGKLIQQEDTPMRYDWVRIGWEDGKAHPYLLHDLYPYLPPTHMCSDVSDDGTILVSGDNFGNLHIWDAETGRIIHKIPTELGLTSGISLSSDGSLVAVSSVAAPGVKLYATKTGELLKFFTDWSTAPENRIWSVSGFSDLDISPDGSILAVGYLVTEQVPEQMAPSLEYVVKLIDLNTYRGLGMLRGYCHLATHMGVYSQKDYVFVGGVSYPQGVKVWNLESGEVERIHRGMPMMSMSADGKKAAIYEYTSKGIELRVYAIPEFKVLYRRIYDKNAPTVTLLSNDGTKILTITSNYVFGKNVSHEFILSVRDWARDEVSFERPLPTSHHDNHFYFSKDDSHLIVADDSLFVIDVGSGEVLMQHDIDYQFGQQWALSEDGKALVVGGKESVREQLVHFVDYKTGKLLRKISTGEEGLVDCLAASPDGRFLAIGASYFGVDYEEDPFPITIWDLQEDKPYCRLPGHSNFIRQMAFGQDSRSFFSVDISGLLKSWNIEDCSEEASFLAYRDLDYLILRPDNYYKASGTGLLGVGFRYKDLLYNFEQFDLLYNRPDLVMKSLGANPFRVKMYELAYQKRLRKFGNPDLKLLDGASLPESFIVDKHLLPIGVEEERFSFEVEAEDPGGQLDRLHVYVNDVPCYGAGGLDIAESGGKWRGKVEVELSKGDNWIQVDVQNKDGLKSPPSTLKVTCHKAFRKPDLYVLMVGVSEFEDESRNLKYAEKDAGDLLKVLSESPVFDEVNARLLVNGEATKEGILEAGRFFEGSQVDDMAVIFVSTHGLLDSQLDYYLATHDVDFDTPTANGLPYEKLEGMLGAIPARNRLILIDACHSGELDRENLILETATDENGVSATAKSGPVLVRPKAGLHNSFEYMRALFADLSKGTGATIISAAGGLEFALESGDWANGVFTYALIEGLGMGKADQDGNLMILVSELREYVGQRVRELTDGAQNPTSRKENLRNDFRIY